MPFVTQISYSLSTIRALAACEESSLRMAEHFCLLADSFLGALPPTVQLQGALLLAPVTACWVLWHPLQSQGALSMAG